MERTYRLTTKAQAEVRAIGRYSAQHWGKNHSLQYIAALKRSFETIAETPGVGRLRNDIRPGIRSFPSGTHLIIYQVDGDVVFILSVRHQSQDVHIPDNLP